jgi:hypothetical protein
MTILGSTTGVGSVIEIELKGEWPSILAITKTIYSSGGMTHPIGERGNEWIPEYR